MRWSELNFRLRTYDISPPGGFCVEQGSFKRCEPDLMALAQLLSQYRKGNGKSRSSVAECVQDCDRFQCLRLGNDPKFCIDCDSSKVVAVSSNSPYITPPCQGCGVVLNQ